MTDAPTPPETIPAPPRLPSDLNHPAVLERRSTDRDLADWQMVKLSLVAMAEAQAEQSRDFEKLTQRIEAAEAARKAEMSALSLLLNERFDSLDLAQRDHSLYLQRLNEIVAGVRSAGESTYDMAKTCAEDLERIREHLGIPDELDAKATSQAPEVGPEPITKSHRPARPVR